MVCAAAAVHVGTAKLLQQPFLRSKIFQILFQLLPEVGQVWSWLFFVGWIQFFLRSNPD